MTAQRLPRLVSRLLVALLLLLPLASFAQAQAPVVPATLIVTVEDPGRALQPGGESPVNVIVNYRPGQGAHPAPDPDEPQLVNKTRITLEPKTLPSWAVGARIEPAEFWVDIPPQGAAGGTFNLRTTMFVNLSADAPALQREEVVVVGRAEPNGNIQGAQAESQPIKLRPAVVGLLNVTSADPLVVIPGGRWSVVPFSVRNDGNSNLTARLNVTLRPENSQVEFPETVTLAPGESTTVEVRVRTPWTNAEAGDLELQALPLLDDESGKASAASVQVSGQSAVPAAPAGVALLTWLALAGARRRRA